MYSANRFPVMLYEGGAVGYAEGGLHDEALAVRKAGRNGDSRLVHVNDEEFAEMVAQYGEPTINPETGMPEFFLGGLGKILKKIAPIAISFIPGIGPVASAALGAGLGALDGGGIKGALLGAATGAVGGAGGAAKIGGALAPGASTVMQKTIGDALIGGAFGAATGQNPLQAALMSGGTSFLRGQLGPKAPATTTQSSTPGATPPIAPSTSDIVVTRSLPATAATSGSSAIPSSTSITDYANKLIAGSSPTTSGYTPSAAATSGSFAIPSSSSITDYANKLIAGSSPTTSGYTPSAATQAAIDAAAGAPTTAAKPNFWNKDFLGLGIAKNKYAIPAVIGAAALADALKPKEDMSMPTQDQFFGPSFNAKSPGSFKLASLSGAPLSESAAAEYAKKYFSGFAVGGDVGDEGHMGHGSFAVHGPGTGRSDEIPAMLSDGEYVMDAETVSMLGDGSSKAGAKKLDDLRVKIRKHKGKSLAKGKFSRDAKPAERYMAGGRI
jgi:hypothetical protein